LKHKLGVPHHFDELETKLLQNNLFTEIIEL